jgi:hypothetical protein
MNSESLAEWFIKQGNEVVRTPSSYWYKAGPGIYQAFPYHWLINPTEKELKNFLYQKKAIGLRYSTQVNQTFGKISYHIIAKNRFELSQFSKKVRHDLQHGLGYASYEPISFDRLAEEGWSVRQDTLKRQGRIFAETQAFWQKLCSSAKGLPGFEAWGAIHDGKLVACILCFVMDGCCSIFYHQSLTDHLKYGINNTLAYAVTNEMFDRGNIDTLFYGIHSLDAPASVDEFKLRMGYTAHLVRQRVVFNPLIAPLFNPLTHSLVKKLCKYRPENPTLTKVEGMIRFYLQGKRPLAQQDWPENLIDQRESFFAGETIQA